MADKKFTTALLITGDASGAQTALKLTQTQIDALTKKTHESAGAWDTWSKKGAAGAATVAKWGVAAAAAAAVGATALIKSSIDSADATGILAGKLGVTTEALSKLQYAAKLSDVSQQSLESGMKRLSRTLTDAAAGTGSASKAFEALGLSAETLINLPVDQQLGAIGDALNGVENASQKAAIAQQIFGRGGVDLLPILKEGSAGIRSMGDELERFGGVISGDMAAKAMQFKDNLDRLKVATTGLGLSLAEEALPHLEALTERLVTLAQDKATMDGIASGLSLIGDAAVTMATSFGKAGAAIQEWRTTSLEEVQAQIVETVRLMETERKWYQNPEMRRGLDEKLAALMQQRDALKLLVVEQKFANVASGHSAEATKKEADTRRDAETVTRALTTSTTKLTQAEKDRREDEMLSIVQKGEADKGLWESKKAVDSLTTSIRESEKVADPWADALQGAVERVDSAFADMWLNIGGGFEDFADSLKDAFSQLLAELAHMAITRPIVMQIGAALGMGGASGSAGGGLGGLLSAGKSFATGGAANAYGLLGDLAGKLGLGKLESAAMGKYFGLSGATGAEALKSLGISAAAGFGGKYLTGSLMDSRVGATGGLLSAGGGFLGSAFGPVGAFAGASIGEAIDRMIGGSDFSGKRVKLGLGTGTMTSGGDWENTRTLASGLQVGNLTRRADEVMSDEQVQQYLGAFDALDATLTSLARLAGVNVNLSGQALPGMPQAYDGGTSGGAFFGSLAKGELRGELAAAPDAFVRQWIDAIAGSFEEPWRTQVASIDGTTDQMIEGFARLVDTMLDGLVTTQEQTAAAEEQVSVVEAVVDAYAQLKAAEEARIDALTAQAQTLIDTYGDLRGAMARIDPPAQTLVDTWRETSDQLGRMTADLADALGQMPEPGAVDRLRATLGTIGSIGGALVSLDREIFDLRVAQGGSAAVALLREREASLFGAIGSSSDPSGTAAEAARVAVQRIQLQARIEEESLNSRLDQTQTIIDLEASARDAQIDGLRQQIDAAESLQSITRDLIGFVDELQFGDLSALNPGDQLGAARSLFDRTLGGARGGDMAALGNLQSVAGSYLQEAQGYFGGATSPYADIFGAVTGALREVGAMGVSDTSLLMQQLTTLESIDAAQQVQADAQQIVIDTTDQQISALGEIREALVDRQADLQDQAEQQTAAANRQIELLQQTVTNQEAEIRQRAAAFEALQTQIVEIKLSLAAMERAADLEAARA